MESMPRPPRAAPHVWLAAWCRKQRMLKRLYALLSLRGLRCRIRARQLQALLARHAFVRTDSWSRTVPAVEAGAAVSHGFPFGVNIVGYLRGEFGLAESARMYARALIDSGTPVALHTLDLGVPHSMADTTFDGKFCADLPEHVVIIFINPDYFDAAVREIGHAKLQGKYVIACWFWELERLPETWLPVLSRVDEILAASEFIADAIAGASSLPVLKAPVPLPAMPRADIGRDAFGMTSGAFVFLFTFDFNSWVERKNPQAVLDAFRQAFPLGTEPVQLIIKTSNGHHHPDALRALADKVSSDPRVIVRNDVITREQLTALQASCDAYVSLHRAEGFGMGMAECMQLGKPVIATSWSGNMEFMDADSAALVRFTLVPVKPGQYPFGEGQRWAEPDATHAASLMAKLAGDPEAATQLGERGRLHVQRVLSPERVARQIMERVSVIMSDANALAASNQTHGNAQRGNQ